MGSPLAELRQCFDWFVLVVQAFQSIGGIHVEECSATRSPASVFVMEEGCRISNGADGGDVFHVTAFDCFKADFDGGECGQ